MMDTRGRRISARIDRLVDLAGGRWLLTRLLARRKDALPLTDLFDISRRSCCSLEVDLP